MSYTCGNTVLLVQVLHLLDHLHLSVSIDIKAQWERLEKCEMTLATLKSQEQCRQHRVCITLGASTRSVQRHLLFLLFNWPFSRNWQSQSCSGWVSATSTHWLFIPYIRLEAAIYYTWTFGMHITNLYKMGEKKYVRNKFNSGQMRISPQKFD